MEVDSTRAIDALPALVWTALADGSVDFVNQRWREYTGLSQERACGSGWQAAIVPDDLPGLLDRWQTILASGVPGEFEARLTRVDGECRRFLIATSAVRDAQGGIVRWYGVSTDIEDRRRAEDALRARERFRVIVDDLPAMVTLMTPDGEFAHGNRHMLDYFGAPLEELKRRPTTESFHPDDRPSVDARWKESVDTGQPYDFEARLRRADGEYRWFHTRGFPLRDAEGRIVLWHLLQTDVDDRKRAEDALRESERESRLIVDSIPGLVALLSASGDVEVVNRQVFEYFGQTLEELRQWGTNDTIHPEDLPHVIAVFSQAIASGSPYHIVQRFRRSDGVYRWFANSGNPLRDPNGHIVRWCVLLTDIDERKRAEDALRASERDLKQIIDTIPALAWSAGPDGRIEFFSQHYLDFIGLSAAQASGWDWTAAVHPEDSTGLASTWQRIIASEAPGEAITRLRGHSGEYRWFLLRASPLRNESGAIVKWYGVSTDIEDRKQAEDALRRSEAFLLEVQRLSHTGGWRYDVATDVVESSPEVQRAYGIQPGEDVTKTPFWLDRVHPDDRARVRSEFERSIREKKEYRAAYRIVLPDGSVRYQHATGHPLMNDAGELVEFFGAAMDMTEYWRATNELERASEALRELQMTMSRAVQVATVAELAASIAHEVTQPLSGIMTNAGTCLRMLDGRPPNLDGARETARRTIRDANRASEVVTRLRALFRKKEFTLEPLDLNEATREVIALSSSDLQRNRVMVQSELADDLPPITGDRVQLQQVILNLLRNASDAMVGVQDRSRQVLIRTEREDGDRVRLSVRDAGTGFDRQSMDKLFQAFYTTKREGMGIGLSVSRSIVESHHGRLWAEPNDGGPGATFAFSIPTDAEKALAAPPAMGTS